MNEVSSNSYCHASDAKHLRINQYRPILKMHLHVTILISDSRIWDLDCLI